MPATRTSNWKSLPGVLLAAVLVLSACGPAPGPEPQSTPPVFVATPPGEAAPSPIPAFSLETAQPTQTLSPLDLDDLSPIEPGNAAALQAVRRFGQGRVAGAAWSADGRILAVFSPLGIAAFEANPLALIRWIETPQPGSEFENSWTDWALSADGARVATMTRHCAIQVWELAGEQAPNSAVDLRDPAAPAVECSRGLVFSPDGALLAAAIPTRGLILLDPSGKLQPRVIVPETTDSPPRPLLGLGFLPNNLGIYASSVSSLAAWDLNSGASLYQLPLQGEAAVLAPDGKTLATTLPGCADICSVQIRDVVSGQTLQSFEWIPDPSQYPQRYAVRLATGLSFSPDGQKVGLQMFDGLVIVWDAASGELLSVLGSISKTPETGLTANDELTYLNQPAFSPDGQLLVSPALSPAIWEVSGGKPAQLLNGYTTAAIQARFLTAGGARRFASLYADGIRVWDTISGLAASDILLPETGAWVGLVPSAKSEQLSALSAQGSLQVWDAEGTATSSSDYPHDPALPLLGVSEDGRFAWDVAGVYDGTTGSRLEALSAALVADQPGQNLADSSLAFSGDGRWLAAGDRQSRITIWDIETAAPVQALEAGLPGGSLDSRAGPLGNGAPVLAFSPDSLFLAGVTRTGLSLWEIASWQPHWTTSAPVTQPAAGAIGALTFSPDSRLLFYAQGSQVYACQAAVSPSPICQTLGGSIQHSAAINHLSIDPAGKLLASSGSDGVVLIWAVR